MALIKGQNAVNAAKDAVVHEFRDVAEQARKLKQDSQHKADRIVAEAEERARQLVEGADERGYDQGYQRGYDEGLAQGQEAGRAEALEQTNAQLQQLQQAWLQAIQQWEADSRQLQQQARDGVVELAIGLARKVIHREIATDPGVIRDQLAHGLSPVMRPLEVTVHLHPEDRPTVEAALPELTQQFAQVQQLHLIEDEQLQRGGCRLSYGQGEIDLTLDKQLDRLVAAIRPDASATQADASAGQAHAETSDSLTNDTDATLNEAAANDGSNDASE
jgi:flagellar biosynthesis/type III secretory pathway protein FliH